jgi:hypothetical protein
MTGRRGTQSSPSVAEAGREERGFDAQGRGGAEAGQEERGFTVQGRGGAEADQEEGGFTMQGKGGAEAGREERGFATQERGRSRGGPGGADARTFGRSGAAAPSGAGWRHRQERTETTGQGSG